LKRKQKHNQKQNQVKLDRAKLRVNFFQSFYALIQIHLFKILTIALIVTIVSLAAYAFGLSDSDRVVAVKDKAYSEFTFTGTLRNDVFDGYGTMDFRNGESFSGSFQDGRFHGEGKLTSAAGTVIYMGGFKDGRMDGFGIYFGSAGWIFEGNFQAGQFHGEGTLISGNEVIKGRWEKGVQVARDESN